MKKFLLLFALVFVAAASCTKEEDDVKKQTATTSTYTVIHHNSDEGGVSLHERLSQEYGENYGSVLRYIKVVGVVNSKDFSSGDDGPFNKFYGIDLSEATVTGNVTLFVGENEDGQNVNMQYDGQGVISSIPRRAFAYNASSAGTAPILREIILPRYTAYIGESAFTGCSNLQTVIIPAFSPTDLVDEGLLVLPDAEGNYPSEEIKETSEAILQGASLREIFPAAFQNCYKLSSITTARGEANCLPEYFVDIEAYAFESCTSLTSIELPESMLAIQDAAFLRCTGLSSFTVPQNVRVMGRAALQECSQITQITMLSSANVPTSADGSLDKTAFPEQFRTSNRNRAILVPADEEGAILAKYQATAGWSYFVVVNSESQLDDDISFQSFSVKSELNTDTGRTTLDDLLVDYCGENYMQEKDVNWSLTVDGIISSKDFERLQNFRSLNLSAVDQVVAEDGVSAQSLPAEAFKGNEVLTDIILPELDLIGIEDSAFEDCVNLTNVTIGKPTNSIGINAFKGCTLLKTVTFSANSVNLQLGDSAFENCRSIEKITMPSNATKGTGITVLGAKVFKDCSALESIDLSGVLESIGDNAFEGCDKLATINTTWIKGYTEMPDVDLSSFPDAFRVGSTAGYAIVIGKIAGDAGTNYNGALGWTLFNLTYDDGTLIDRHILNLPASEGVNSENENVTLESQFADYRVNNGGVFSEELKITGSMSEADLGVLNVAGITQVDISKVEGLNNISNEAFINAVDMVKLRLPATIVNLGNDIFTARSKELAVYLPWESTPSFFVEGNELPKENVVLVIPDGAFDYSENGWDSYAGQYKTVSEYEILP